MARKSKDSFGAKKGSKNANSEPEWVTSVRVPESLRDDIDRIRWREHHDSRADTIRMLLSEAIAARLAPRRE